jgi:lycopene beta-cyclase
VRVLRRRGLAVLLALPPHRVPEFFELFFCLPAGLQRSYLGGREDVGGTAAAMAAIVRAADRSMRSLIVQNALFPRTLRAVS